MEVLFWLVLKVKVYYENKFMVILNRSKKTLKKSIQIKIKSVLLGSTWSKTLNREIKVPLLEQQGKSLFCIGSSWPSGLPEHHREMINGSFKSCFSYLRALYKFCHLQVPYGTKIAFFVPFLKGGGLAGYQDIVD